MFYLLLSVLFASLLFVVFKLFSVYKVNTLQAITVNYIIAFSLGIFMSEVPVKLIETPNKPWFFWAIFLGFLFIIIFFIMALTAQKNGLSVASVAGKMSVVIPVIFGIIIYKESVGFLKIVGVVLALFAVYLSSAKKETQPTQFKNLLFPLLLFIGSGTIDTSLKFVEKNYVSKEETPLFLATIFGTAFLMGSFYLLYQIVKKRVLFQSRNVLAGLVLGIVNYYSMIFLLKALQTKGVESSVIFTVNNVAIVLFTTVLALIFFKEKLIKKNWIGIVLSVISILLVMSS